MIQRKQRVHYDTSAFVSNLFCAWHGLEKIRTDHNNNNNNNNNNK